MVVKGGCADAEGVSKVSSISADARFCQQMLLEESVERALARCDCQGITSPANQTESIEQPSQENVSITLGARRRVLFETDTEHRYGARPRRFKALSWQTVY